MNQLNNNNKICNWCGNTKSIKYHKKVCPMLKKKPYVNNPDEYSYSGAGNPDFEVAQRKLRGEYYTGNDGKPMMMNQQLECT